MMLSEVQPPRPEPRQGIQKFVWQFAGAAVSSVMVAVAVPRDEYWTEPFYLALASVGLQVTSAFLTYIVPNLRDMKHLKETVALTFIVLQVLVAIIPGGITQLEIQQIGVAVAAFFGTAAHSNGPITGSLSDPPVPTVVETQVPIPITVPEGTSVSVEKTTEEVSTDTQRIQSIDGTETREVGGYTFTFQKE